MLAHMAMSLLLHADGGQAHGRASKGGITRQALMHERSMLVVLYQARTGRTCCAALYLLPAPHLQLYIQVPSTDSYVQGLPRLSAHVYAYRIIVKQAIYGGNQAG